MIYTGKHWGYTILCPTFVLQISCYWITYYMVKFWYLSRLIFEESITLQIGFEIGFEKTICNVLDIFTSCITCFKNLINFPASTVVEDCDRTDCISNEEKSMPNQRSWYWCYEWSQKREESIKLLFYEKLGDQSSRVGKYILWNLRSKPGTWILKSIELNLKMLFHLFPTEIYLNLEYHRFIIKIIFKP